MRETGCFGHGCCTRGKLDINDLVWGEVSMGERVAVCFELGNDGGIGREAFVPGGVDAAGRVVDEYDVS